MNDDEKLRLISLLDNRTRTLVILPLMINVPLRDMLVMPADKPVNCLLYGILDQNTSLTASFGVNN